MSCDEEESDDGSSDEDDSDGGLPSIPETTLPQVQTARKPNDEKPKKTVTFADDHAKSSSEYEDLRIEFKHSPNEPGVTESGDVLRSPSDIYKKFAGAMKTKILPEETINPTIDEIVEPVPKVSYTSPLNI